MVYAAVYAQIYKTMQNFYNCKMLYNYRLTMVITKVITLLITLVITMVITLVITMLNYQINGEVSRSLGKRKRHWQNLRSWTTACTSVVTRN